MNLVSHNLKKYNNNISQDHLVHRIPWPNTNKMQILNINHNNLVNLPSTKIWASKFLHKFILTNLSISKLFQKVRSRKKKKKMKTQAKNKIKYNMVKRNTMISKMNNKSTRNKTRMENTTRNGSTLKRTKMNMTKINKFRMIKLLEKKEMKNKN